MESLKDYVIKALVNTVDHMGSLAYKVNGFLDASICELSRTELRLSCIEQVFLLFRLLSFSICISVENWTSFPLPKKKCVYYINLLVTISECRIFYLFPEFFLTWKKMFVGNLRESEHANTSLIMGAFSNNHYHLDFQSIISGTSYQANMFFSAIYCCLNLKQAMRTSFLPIWKIYKRVCVFKFTWSPHCFVQLGQPRMLTSLKLCITLLKRTSVSLEVVLYFIYPNDACGVSKHDILSFDA